MKRLAHWALDLVGVPRYRVLSATNEVWIDARGIQQLKTRERRVDFTLVQRLRMLVLEL